MKLIDRYPTLGSSVRLDNGHIRRNFGRAIDLTAKVLWVRNDEDQTLIVPVDLDELILLHEGIGRILVEYGRAKLAAVVV